MQQDTRFSDYLRFVFTRHGRRGAFLLYTVYLYLGSVLVFAGIYYALFLRNPATFAFSADILSAQATTFKLAARRDSVTAELQIGLLRGLVDTLARLPASTPLVMRSGPEGEEATFLYAGREYSMAKSSLDPPGTGGVTIRQEGGATLMRIELPAGKLDATPHTTGEFRQEGDSLIAFLRDQLVRSHDLVARLPSVVRSSWGYIDFVYFSAITQLTVGYGDILPNTTLVRVLVVVQSLVAVVMLVVVINVVLTVGTSPDTGKKAK